MIHRLSKRGRAQLCDSQIHRREREGKERARIWISSIWVVRGKRDCVYGRGPTRESIRMAIGSSDLFPVALVGCQCSCMASKRRASFIYFYQEKFSGDRSSPLDPMRPTQLDKGLIIQISGIGCKLSFFVFWWPFFFFFTNLTGGEKEKSSSWRFVCLSSLCL